MSDLCYTERGGGGDAARGGASIKISRGARGSPQIGLPRAAGQDLDAAISRCGREAWCETDSRVAEHAADYGRARNMRQTSRGDVDLLSVAHGDFRCDNLIYDEDGSVRAILDWELATLGHLLADVAYLCMPYEIPPFVAGPLSGFRGPEFG